MSVGRPWPGQAPLQEVGVGSWFKRVSVRPKSTCERAQIGGAPADLPPSSEPHRQPRAKACWSSVLRVIPQPPDETFVSLSSISDRQMGLRKK